MYNWRRTRMVADRRQAVKEERHTHEKDDS